MKRVVKKCEKRTAGYYHLIEAQLHFLRREFLVIVAATIFSGEAFADINYDVDRESIKEDLQVFCVGDCEGTDALTLEKMQVFEDGQKEIEPELEEDSHALSGSDVVSMVQAAVLFLNPNGTVLVRHPVTRERVTLDLDRHEHDLVTSEGVITDDLYEARYVTVYEDVFPSGQARFAGSSNLTRSRNTHWNECEGRVTGQYLTHRCQRRSINTGLYELLNEVPRMVGARRIFIVHVGIAGDRAHQSRRSLHNTNRAIDIREIRLGGRDGERYVYRHASLGRSRERRFYAELIEKWESAVRRRCGSIVASSAVNWTHPDHRHDLQLSVR